MMFLDTAIGLLLATTFGNEPALEKQFREQVAPVLAKHCVGCHRGATPDGGLSLETAKQALAGGDSGPVISKNKPEESLLLDYISGDEPEMPKDADPLTKAQVERIREWIAAGAAWPEDLRLVADESEKLSWWSLQPMHPPAAPEVADKGWIRNPIDAFVLKKLNEQGLSPSREADRRTLIRRLTFDLHGLPPAPEEIDRFVADESPTAYEQLVERLLASSRYGERWGRHWLDVVHYGDTHGYDKDKRRPNSWPYRDYVIDSFNRDMPYARFLREQIAGDILFPEDPRGIVATGFIVAGPWDFVGHVELREGSTDKTITRVLDRDDMVTNAMSTFASVTVHCARCHNHKFDPITQEEYYGLQAVFAGVERADRSYDVDPQITKTRQQLAARETSLAGQIAAIEAKIDSQVTPEIRLLDQQIAETEHRIQTFATFQGPPLANRTLGYHSNIETSAEHEKWVQLDLGESQPIEEILLVPAHAKYLHHPGPGFGFPVRFRVEISDDPEFKESQVLQATEEDFPNPGDAVVAVAAKGGTGRYVRVTATRLWKRSDDFAFALSELVVMSGGNNIASKAMAQAKDSIEAGTSWGTAYVVDGIANQWSLTEKTGDSPSNGYHSHIEATPDHVKWVQVDLGEPTAMESIWLIPARPTDFPDTPGFGFPVRFRVEVADDPQFASPRVLMDATAEDYPNPRDVSVVVDARGNVARYVRVTANKLWERRDDYCMALGELRVTRNDNNLALAAPVTAMDSIEAGRWSTRHLTDDNDSRKSLSTPLERLRQSARVAQWRQVKSELVTRRKQEAARSIDPKLADQLTAKRSELTQIRHQLGELPAASKVYAAANQFEKQGSFTPAPNGIREVHLLGRGNVQSPVKLVQPSALSCVTGLSDHFANLSSKGEGERRVALANWLADRQNPLTWRSIVNRIWHYHFGRGIVDSPNDFGKMGSLPSHPELLDWLATTFRDNGQSFKQLHRLVVCSATYRQVSSERADAAAVDGGNSLLWRMNRQRLDAESIRDAVLTVTGSMDWSMGGPGYDLFAFKDDHSPHYMYDKHDVDAPATLRRSVYRFVVRSVPDPLMECLDCADPSSQVPVRNETITALQALSLLNNPLLISQSRRLAERLRGLSPTPEGQIDAAFRLAYGRLPEPAEKQAVAEYSRTHGLENVCRLILNSNEFLFVD